MDMAEQDWATPEYLANLTAEELTSAMEQLGVRILGCWPDDDGLKINIAFQTIRDAELLVSLGVPDDHRPGTLYDHASASCVTLASFADYEVAPTDAEFDAATAQGWNWTIHPDMVGWRMDWHVSVDMPADDARRVTANLNALRIANNAKGGAS